MASTTNDAPGPLALERHEASVWAAIVDATAQVEGNQLRAEVNRAGATPLPVVATLDSARFNRVIAPEALLSNPDSELDRLCAFYSDRAQAHIAIEVPPAMSTATLASALSMRGLIDRGYRVAKTMRPTNDVVHDDGLPTAFELGLADRSAWAATTRAAWAMPRLMSPWFGSTFGSPGFHHFGIIDGNELVAVGAIHVAGDFAWLGFDATHPKHQGQGMQLALLAHRVRAAAELGCRWAHSETLLTEGEKTNASLRNMLRAGFIQLHDRIVYES